MLTIHVDGVTALFNPFVPTLLITFRDCFSAPMGEGFRHDRL